MSVSRRGFVIMIGRIHQSDSTTIQIEVVVKEPALAQKLPRSNSTEGDPCEHDCDRSGCIRWRCTRRGDGIRARAFLEPRANGPRSLPCLAIIVHFAMGWLRKQAQGVDRRQRPSPVFGPRLGAQRRRDRHPHPRTPRSARHPDLAEHLGCRTQRLHRRDLGGARSSSAPRVTRERERADPGHQPLAWGRYRRCFDRDEPSETPLAHSPRIECQWRRISLPPPRIFGRSDS